MTDNLRTNKKAAEREDDAPPGSLSPESPAPSTLTHNRTNQDGGPNSEGPAAPNSTLGKAHSSLESLSSSKSSDISTSQGSLENLNDRGEADDEGQGGNTDNIASSSPGGNQEVGPAIQSIKTQPISEAPTPIIPSENGQEPKLGEAKTETPAVTVGEQKQSEQLFKFYHDKPPLTSRQSWIKIGIKILLILGIALTVIFFPPAVPAIVMLAATILTASNVYYSSHKLLTLCRALSVIQSLAVAVLVIAAIGLGPIGIGLMIASFIANYILFSQDIPVLLNSMFGHDLGYKTISEYITKNPIKSALALIFFPLTIGYFVGKSLVRNVIKNPVNLIKIPMALSTSFVLCAGTAAGSHALLLKILLLVGISASGPWGLVALGVVLGVAFLANTAFVKRGLDKFQKVITDLFRIWKNPNIIFKDNKGEYKFSQKLTAIFMYCFDIPTRNDFKPYKILGRNVSYRTHAFLRILTRTALLGGAIALCVFSQIGLINGQLGIFSKIHYLNNLIVKGTIQFQILAITGYTTRILVALPKVFSVIYKIIRSPRLSWKKLKQNYRQFKDSIKGEKRILGAKIMMLKMNKIQKHLDDMAKAIEECIEKPQALSRVALKFENNEIKVNFEGKALCLPGSPNVESFTFSKDQFEQLQGLGLIPKSITYDKQFVEFLETIVKQNEDIFYQCVNSNGESQENIKFTAKDFLQLKKNILFLVYKDALVNDIAEEIKNENSELNTCWNKLSWLGRAYYKYKYNSNRAEAAVTYPSIVANGVSNFVIGTDLRSDVCNDIASVCINTNAVFTTATGNTRAIMERFDAQPTGQPSTSLQPKAPETKATSKNDKSSTGCFSCFGFWSKSNKPEPDARYSVVNFAVQRKRSGSGSSQASFQSR